MPVTVKQIAELAGVSRGTVDRALNGRGNVRPEVEKRILQIAEEMGYTPNRAGKALAYQRKNLSFGIVANAHGNEFFDDLLKGAQTAADEYSDFGLSLKIAGGAGMMLPSSYSSCPISRRPGSPASPSAPSTCRKSSGKSTSWWRLASR